MGDLFIHIGLPKTGTTVLQKHYFPALPGIHYLGKPYEDRGDANNPPRKAKALWELVTNPRLYFEKKHEEFLNKLGVNRSETSSAEKFLISDELVMNYILLPRLIVPYMIDPHRHYIKRSEYFAACIKDVFEKLAIVSSHSRDSHDLKIKLIITIRRQDEQLHSSYTQHYPAISRMPWGKSFESFAKHQITDGFYRHGGYGSDYHYLLKSAYEYFDPAEVCMIPYELMRDCPEEFATRLATFIGANPSGTEELLKYKENVRQLSPSHRRTMPKPRWLFTRLSDVKRRFFPQVRLGLSGLKVIKRLGSRSGKVIELKPETRERIMDRYKSSNKALDQILDYNLQSYGYY